MSNLPLSIIIVNYQSAALLETGLPSLERALTTISHEYIVVNNDVNESEALHKLQKKYAFGLKELSANFGFSRANNEGGKIAKGDYILFLNPDTEYVSGSFVSLLTALASHPRDIFGLSLHTLSGEPEAWSYGSIPTLFSLLTNKLVSQKTLIQGKRTKKVGWVSGAALVLSRETFLSLGGFDEHFFLYYEDVDLCLRAENAGSCVFWYPFLSFIHKRGQSHGSQDAMKRAYFEGQRLFFEKHGAKIEKFSLSLLQPFYRRFFS